MTVQQAECFGTLVQDLLEFPLLLSSNKHVTQCHVHVFGLGQLEPHPCLAYRMCATAAT